MSIVELERKVATLEELVRKQMELLGRNSGNSNLPPSSDGPGTSGGPGKRSKKGKRRKRGGQAGHKGSHRLLVPADKVDDFVELFPPECENCWQLLPEIPDSHAKRYQHTELAPRMPWVREYPATKAAGWVFRLLAPTHQAAEHGCDRTFLRDQSTRKGQCTRRAASLDRDE